MPLTVYVRRKRIITKNSRRKFEGIFRANRRGFGFVQLDDQDKDDIFIPAKFTASAFNGDKVQGEITAFGTQGRKNEGRILKILDRAVSKVAGTLLYEGDSPYVISDNTSIPEKIWIPAGKLLGAREGDKVSAAIIKYADASGRALGEVTQVIGGADLPGADITSLVLSYDIPTEFPQEVQAAAKALPKRVYPRDLKDRADLRGLQTITVDGEHTKDFDDAVSLTFENGIYHLGVHIADVSHYVPEGSPIDQEALARSTSNYLPDRVIPMLPFELSNGICSLNEKRNRLTLSCIMDFTPEGQRVRYHITKAVIRTAHRMTYTQVQNIFNGDTKTRDRFEDVVPMIEQMGALAHALNQQRKRRGMIDFEFPEAEIILDKKEQPTDIILRERTEATQMIEEFMLAANETVAEAFCKRKIPFLYRRHGKPDGEKVRELKRVAAAFGLSLTGNPDDMSPAQIQALLAQADTTSAKDLINMLTLRSMQKADYGPDCIGHFGLASQYYCHFTSPIRRYPDLQIHRIISEYLAGTMDEKRQQHYEDILTGVGAKTSTAEKRSDELEREADSLEMCKYMKQHIGETFDGIISGVTSWGLYVRLENTVEGMVPLSSLNGYYVYDEQHYSVRRADGKVSYTYGQWVTIQVQASDVLTRNIDFAMVEDPETPVYGLGHARARRDNETVKAKNAKSKTSKTKTTKSGGKMKKKAAAANAEQNKQRGKGKAAAGQTDKKKRQTVNDSLDKSHSKAEKRHEFQVKKHGKKGNRRKISRQ